MAIYDGITLLCFTSMIVYVAKDVFNQFKR